MTILPKKKSSRGSSDRDGGGVVRDDAGGVGVVGEPPNHPATGVNLWPGGADSLHHPYHPVAPPRWGASPPLLPHHDAMPGCEAVPAARHHRHHHHSSPSTGHAGSGGLQAGSTSGGCTSGVGGKRRHKQHRDRGQLHRLHHDPRGGGGVGTGGSSLAAAAGLEQQHGAASSKPNSPTRRGSGGGSPEPGYNSDDEHAQPAGATVASATQYLVPSPNSLDERENMFEETLKATRGFIIKKMGEDGACLFRAVADQVYGDQEMHDIVRKHCMDYMLKNRDYFSQYITEDFDLYISRKREDHCHGNHTNTNRGGTCSSSFYIVTTRHVILTSKLDFVSNKFLLYFYTTWIYKGTENTVVIN